MAFFEHLRKILAKIKLVFKNINIGYNSGSIGDNMGNTSIGNNSGIVGNDNTIIFNSQTHLTQEQVEAEFMKLESGDFIDITDEVDTQYREKNIVIWGCIKDSQLQLKQQIVNDDFQGEKWIPEVPADMGKREKKPYLKITPVYREVIFPFSYFFILMDGLRYFVPLPKVECNSIRDRNNPVKRYTITKVQYQLGKILTHGEYYNTSYDDMLKQCKIEVV
jgi:hypothetical protein